MNRKLILAGAAAFVLAALALATAYLYIPGGVRPSFSEGDVRVYLGDGGTVQLRWPQARVENDTGGLPDAAETVPEEDGKNPPEAPAEDAGDQGPPVSYSLNVKSGDQHIQKLLSSPDAFLGQLALPLSVRIQAVVEGKNLLGLTRRLTSQTLAVQVDSVELNAPEVVGTPGPGNLSLSWTLPGGTAGLYEVYAQGDADLVASTASKAMELKVGRGGDVPLPGYHQPLEVSVRAAFQGKGYVLCGPASNLIRVERQDLLGDDLNLAYHEEEPRVVSLEWDETRGEFYEVHEWHEGGWTLLDTLEPAEHFLYDLGRLGSGSHHRFQVAALDRNGTLRSSEEVEFFAAADPLYATVWPIIEQPFYEKADGSSPTLGKIPGGTALCVLEESGDWFSVRYKDQYGWVDSRFCMINLPEYVGDHCSYDIANSYRSVFKVHENPIALITDQVIQGFEHIQTADEQFLVPYLYPCSKKLLSAAQAAEKDGYRLKIYEAFRPNEATRFLYDTTAGQLELAALVYSYENAGGEPLGEDEEPRILDPVTGWEVDLSDGLLIDPETEEKISREDLALRQAEEEAGKAQEDAETVPPGPDGQPIPAGPQEGDTPENPPFFTLPAEGEGGSLAPAPETESQPAPEPAPQPTPQTETPEGAQAPEGEEDEEGGETEEPVEYDTYFTVMTNGGRFSLGSFLARVTSAHNRGIALDLTLETIDGKEELEMQSAIHDLSWYSAAYLNNDNAKLLEKYMTATGMRGLSSEWWHFQDDETREAIGLSSYLFKGVNMGGWTKDDQGWRYRDEDGSVLRDTAFKADGNFYTADQDGYVLP